MSRYKNTKVSTSIGNNIGYKNDTTIYSDVPESNEDMYVITQFGDRLDNLANKNGVTLY